MRKKMPVILTAVVTALFLFSATASAAISGGSTIGSAPTVSMGATSITYGGSITYFKFIAPKNYSYEIYSSDITGDSYGYLFNSAGTQLTSNDDGGAGLNFKIKYTLSGGVTYYIGVRNYSGTAANTCNLNIDYGNAPPVVTDGNISISGSSGIYKIGDTVTATWDNTAHGDNNDDISSVRVNFSEFGGGSAVLASNSSGVWTAAFTLTSGNIDATNRNVSITAYDTGGLSTTTADTTNASLDNQVPVVTDANISISGATGNGGVFIIGDTVTAEWDNTSSGDNNSDIVDVTVDFSEFGGGSAIAASNNSGTWTSTYTIAEDSIEALNLNVSITAIDDAGQQTNKEDSTDAAVDSIFPTVNLSCSDSDYLVKGGDTVIITASFSEEMSVSPQITIDRGDVSMEEMTDMGSGTTWTYEWNVPFSDTSVVVSISGSDVSGNPYNYSDFIDIKIDNTKPIVTGVSDGEVYITGQTIFFNEGTAILNNFAIENGIMIKKINDYQLVVTDRAGNVTTMEFSIALEKATALVGNYYYRLIDIERETNDKETKVMLNVNSEVLAMVLDTKQENKDIKVTVSENKADNSTRKFSLGMTLADLQLIRSKGDKISLITEIGSFDFDPKFINADRLLNSFIGVEEKDIRVELKISPAHYFRKYVIGRALETDGNTVVSEAVSYDLYCSYGIKTVTTVSLYGEMDMLIPIKEKYITEGLQAVRLRTDMTLEAIDTEIVNENGIYYAKFRSLMNGTFALVTEK